jgi:hypothetical protein
MAVLELLVKLLYGWCVQVTMFSSSNHIFSCYCLKKYHQTEKLAPFAPDNNGMPATVLLEE